MKRKIIIAIAAILVIGIGAITNYEIIRPLIAEAACSVANCREQGGARWTIGSGGDLDILSSGELNVESGGTLDMEAGSIFEVAGQAITLPTSAGAILQSSLTTNQIDGANSIWGASDALVFESGAADDFEFTMAPLNDVTSDVTFSMPSLNSVAAVVSTLITNDIDVVSSIWLVSGGIRAEGTADAFETTLTFVDPLEDNTITLPEESGSVPLINIVANADIDDATNTNNWATSDQANWTVITGTSNGRDGGNTIEFKTDATDNDELLMDNTSVISAALGNNYIGFWMRNEGGDIIASEFDVDLRDSGGSGISNCTEMQIPSMDQNDWTWVEFDTSTCDLSDFQMVAIVADTGITALTAVDVGGIITYDISNGHGPVMGRLEYHPVASGTVTKGEVVCWPTIGTETNGVETCGANDFLPAGIATNTSTTFVIIQVSGRAIMEAGNAISDGADIDVLSGAVTIDDAGSQENSFGWALEAAADSNDFIYVRLQF